VLASRGRCELVLALGTSNTVPVTRVTPPLSRDVKNFGDERSNAHKKRAAFAANLRQCRGGNAHAHFKLMTALPYVSFLRVASRESSASEFDDIRRDSCYTTGNRLVWLHDALHEIDQEINTFGET
jgi:hypothetical protein